MLKLTTHFDLGPRRESVWKFISYILTPLFHGARVELQRLLGR
jgi:hypothetical protein